MTSKLDADKLFGIHEDIRHVIVADKMGKVTNIFSKAKTKMPNDLQRQFVGVIASISYSLGEKVRDFAGDVECVVVYHEKLKILIAKSANNLYVISARKSLPEEAVYKLVALIKSEG